MLQSDYERWFERVVEEAPRPVHRRRSIETFRQPSLRLPRVPDCRWDSPLVLQHDAPSKPQRSTRERWDAKAETAADKPLSLPVHRLSNTSLMALQEDSPTRNISHARSA